jgi:hypothetical protein
MVSLGDEAIDTSSFEGVNDISDLVEVRLSE